MVQIGDHLFNYFLYYGKNFWFCNIMAQETNSIIYHYLITFFKNIISFIMLKIQNSINIQ